MGRQKEKAPAGTGADAAEAAGRDRPQYNTNGRDSQEFELPLLTVADGKLHIRRYCELLPFAEDDLIEAEAEAWRNIATHHLTQRGVREGRKFAKVQIKHLPEYLQTRAEFDLLEIVKSQEADAPKVRTEDYIRALAGLGYTFRLNLTDDSIEVNDQRLSDPLRAKMRSQIRDLGFKGIEALEDAWTAEAYDQRYHPMKEYFAGLEWDGQPHIALLASYFTDKHDIFYSWLRRWLIGAVAKVDKGTQNPMLALDGPQDIGKSFFVAWLASPMPGYFYEGPINTDDKDSYIRLMAKFIWEVAELGSTTRRTDREALKYFLSMETVTVRKPYGRLDTIKPAMASFVGTVNDEAGILSDPTGSRRFLVCGLTAINWDYAKEVDANQVWAEALAAYRDGEPWRLTPEELERRRAINAEFEIEDPIEDLLKKYFILKPTDANLWTATADILDVLETNGLRGNRRGNSMALATTLRRLGFEKAKGRLDNGAEARGYNGIDRPTGL